MSDESFVRQLMASAKCEVCGQPYEENNINVLGHEEEMWVLQVNCGACHSQSLIAALIDEGPATEENTNSPIEEISDLLDYEQEEFKDRIITGNDFLDMCNFLNGYEGNFSQLFRRAV